MATEAGVLPSVAPMDSTAELPETRPLKEKKIDYEKVKGDIIALFDEAVEFKKPWTTRALEMYSLFRSVENEADAKKAGHRYKGRSRVIDPEANRVLETVAARVARGATVRYSPEETSDVERAKALTEVAAHYLRKNRFGVKSRLWVKEALITGTGFLKLTWDYKKRTVRKRVPRFVLRNPLNGKEMARFGLTTKFVEQIERDMPKIEVLDFGDVFVSPHATDPLDYPHIFHAFRVSDKSKLKDNPNYDQKKVDKIGESTEDMKKKHGEQFKEDKYKATGASLPTDDKGIHGIEFSGEYDLYADGNPVQCIVTIVGDQVIRAEENPFFYNKPPIIAYRPIPVPHEFYGMALLEASSSMFHAVTALRRQRIDAGTLSLNPILRVLRTAGVVKSQLVSSPGAIWEQDDPAGIQPIQMPEPSQFSYAEIRELKRDIRDATGASEFISGGDNLASNRTTAAEYVGKVEQANLKFRQMLDMFEEEALMEFGDMLKAHIFQFMSEPVLVRLLGEGVMPDMLRVRPKDLIGNGDYDTVTETEASAIGNKQQRFNQIVTGYNMLINSPFVDGLKLTRKLMEEGLEWKDANEIMVNPAQIQNAQKKDQMFKADTENQDPLNAKIRPDDDHAVHLDVHDAFIGSDVFQELSPEEQQALVEHREQHRAMLEQATGMSADGGMGGGQSGSPKSGETMEEEAERGPGRPPLASPSVEEV